MNSTIIEPEQGTGRRRVWPSVTVWLIASCAAAAGLLAVQPASGVSMQVLSLVMLAPGIGAGAVWLVARDRLPDFGAGAPRTGFGVAAVLSLAVVAVYFVTMAVVTGRSPTLPAEVAGTPVAVVILAQAVGALTEEIGFRGVVFHALAGRTPRLVASLLTGIGFAVWHVHHLALPPGELAAFFGGTVALTLTMTGVMAGSFWQRMAVCTIIHLGANLALAFHGEAASMYAFGLTLGVGCVVVVPVALVLGRRAADIGG